MTKGIPTTIDWVDPTTGARGRFQFTYADSQPLLSIDSGAANVQSFVRANIFHQATQQGKTIGWCSIKSRVTSNLGFSGIPYVINVISGCIKE